MPLFVVQVQIKKLPPFGKIHSEDADLGSQSHSNLNLIFKNQKIEGVYFCK
jgi:hypothetical protein